MGRNKNGKDTVKAGTALASHKRKPRSLSIAEHGVHTSHDFADFMSALMSDLIEGNVAPNVGNAACNAGGKLLRVVELQYRYGTAIDGAPKTLILSIGAGTNEKPTKAGAAETHPRETGAGTSQRGAV